MEEGEDEAGREARLRLVPLVAEAVVVDERVSRAQPTEEGAVDVATGRSVPPPCPPMTHTQ